MAFKYHYPATCAHFPYSFVVCFTRFFLLLHFTLQSVSLYLLNLKHFKKNLKQRNKNKTKTKVNRDGLLRREWNGKARDRKWTEKKSFQ